MTTVEIEKAPATGGTSAWADPARLYRLTGGALIAAFAFSAIGGMAHPIVDHRSHSAESLLAPASPWAQLLIYTGSLFLMLGLPGLFVWLARRSFPVIGLIGVGLYMLANALSAQSHLVVEAFVAPAIASDPAARHLIPSDGSIVDSAPFASLQLVGGLVLIGSVILMGIGFLRSPVAPRWVGALLIVGGLAYLIPFTEIPVLTGLYIEVPRGLSLAAVGYLMLHRRHQPERRGDLLFNRFD